MTAPSRAGQDRRTGLWQRLGLPGQADKVGAVAGGILALGAVGQGDDVHQRKAVQGRAAAQVLAEGGYGSGEAQAPAGFWLAAGGGQGLGHQGALGLPGQFVARLGEGQFGAGAVGGGGRRRGPLLAPNSLLGQGGGAQRC